MMFLSASVSLLTGCSTSFAPAFNPPTDPSSLGTIKGVVHGGQQPVGTSHIYVFAVGTGGYGTKSTSLLLPGIATTPDSSNNYFVTTDPSGNFSITGDYLCTAGTQVYLYASGGDSGSGNNAAIGLLAGIGECPASRTLAAQVPYVTVNEISTIATAYALSGFATDPTHIASASTVLAKTGTANAMANIPNIISITDGTALATSPSGAADNPVPNINTLANILAACVNSGGGIASPCATLFGNAGSQGPTTGTAPTDTATAAINLAHYPFGNIATLYALQTAPAPFQPTLTSAPAELTIALYYTQTPAYMYNQVNNPTGTGTKFAASDAIAFDANGDAWIQSALVDTNMMYGSSSGGYYTHLSPSGQVLTNVVSTLGASDVGASTIAIDNTGNLWGPSGTSVVEISSEGTTLSPSAGYTCPGMSYSTSIIFAKNGIAFVGDQDTSSVNGDYTIWELDQGTGACAGSLDLGKNDYSGYISTNSKADIFAVAGYDNQLLKVAFGSTAPQAFPISGSAFYLATDASDDVWLSETDATGLAEALYTYSSGGALVSPSSGYTGGGLTPGASTDGAGVPVIDGAGAVWTPVIRYVENGPEPIYIAAISNSGAAITASSGLQIPYGQTESIRTIAPDGSGNLWAVSLNGSIIEFLGLTTPVATPILYNQLGTRP